MQEFDSCNTCKKSLRFRKENPKDFSVEFDLPGDYAFEDILKERINMEHYCSNKCFNLAVKEAILTYIDIQCMYYTPKGYELIDNEGEIKHKLCTLHSRKIIPRIATKPHKRCILIIF